MTGEELARALGPIWHELAGQRAALERIAVALERVTAPCEEPPAVVGCLHPLEQRQDFGVTNGVDDWRCSACGFRSVQEQVGP